MQFTVQRFFETHRGYCDFEMKADGEQYTTISCSTAENRGNEKVVLLICKSGSDQIGKKSILHFVHQFPPTEYDHFILLCIKVSRQALDMLDYYQHSETLSFDDLLVSRLEHKYVPKYQILSEAEVTEVKSKFGNPQQFPKIRRSVDVIARLLDFRPGQVLRATIQCPVQGATTVFRYVIA